MGVVVDQVTRDPTPVVLAVAMASIPVALVVAMAILLVPIVLVLVIISYSKWTIIDSPFFLFRTPYLCNSQEYT